MLINKNVDHYNKTNHETLTRKENTRLNFIMHEIMVAVQIDGGGERKGKEGILGIEVAGSGGSGGSVAVGRFGTAGSGGNVGLGSGGIVG